MQGYRITLADVLLAAFVAILAQLAGAKVAGELGAETASSIVRLDGSEAPNAYRCVSGCAGHCFKPNPGVWGPIGPLVSCYAFSQLVLLSLPSLSFSLQRPIDQGRGGRQATRGALAPAALRPVRARQRGGGRGWRGNGQTREGEAPPVLPQKLQLPAAPAPSQQAARRGIGRARTTRGGARGTSSSPPPQQTSSSP